MRTIPEPELRARHVGKRLFSAIMCRKFAGVTTLFWHLRGRRGTLQQRSCRFHNETVACNPSPNGEEIVKGHPSFGLGLVVATGIGWAAASLIGISTAVAETSCNGFFNNSDGSWTPTHPIMIGAPTSQTQLMPSDRLRDGDPGVKGSVAHFLNLHCRAGGITGRALNIPQMP